MKIMNLLGDKIFFYGGNEEILLYYSCLSMTDVTPLAFYYVLTHSTFLGSVPIKDETLFSSAA